MTNFSFLNSTNKLKKTFMIFFSLLTFSTFAVAVFGFYVGQNIVNPTRVAIQGSPADYGLIYEDVSFTNEVDSVKLEGWWIPSEVLDFPGTRKAIVFSHSYGDNREKMPIETLKLASKLAKEGYNVLMFDFRNSGNSEKSATTIGLKEKTDLMTAIKFVSEEKGIRNIGLIGWSMGAATSILAGSEANEVKAVVADSSFADLEEYAQDSFQYWTGLPKFTSKFFTDSAKVFAPELNVEGVKPYLAAREYENKGLMLIHSRKDGAINYKESETIHKNSTAKDSELWLTNKGGHIRNYKHHKEEYEEKVINFFEKNVSNKEANKFTYLLSRI